MSELASVPLALLAWTLVMKLAIVNAGIIIRPHEFLELRRNYTLSNLEQSPRDRCTPEPDHVAEARSATRECNLMYGVAPYEGKCYPLMERGPCPANHWIALDKRTERTVCQFQACPNQHVLMAGGCTRLGLMASSRHCGESFQLIVNEYGEAECECPAGHVFHRPTKRCYPPYHQGPCRHRHTLQVVQNGSQTIATCLPSLCLTAGQVPMTPSCQLVQSSSGTVGDGDYQCYSLLSTGPCREEGFLTLDRAMVDVVCSFSKTYGLWNSLSGMCIPASRRDDLRSCVRSLQSVMAYAVTKIPPTVKPGIYSNGNNCPDGYVFVGGTCLHIQSGV